MSKVDNFNKFLKSIGGLEMYNPEPDPYNHYWKHGAFRFIKWLGITDYNNPFRMKILDRDYFSVTNGWLIIIESMIKELIHNGWNKKLIQCKEKFGGLRFYTGSCSEKCHEIISKYESLSLTTCEKCGEEGQAYHMDRRWVVTLCEECKNLK